MQPLSKIPPKAFERTYQRLLPRLEARFETYSSQHPQEWQDFRSRIDEHFPRLFGLLIRLYGEQFDFFYYIETLLYSLAASWIERPTELKELDRTRELNPDWYQSNQMMGGVCYVDAFCQ